MTSQKTAAKETTVKLAQKLFLSFLWATPFCLFFFKSPAVNTIIRDPDELKKIERYKKHFNTHFYVFQPP